MKNEFKTWWRSALVGGALALALSAFGACSEPASETRELEAEAMADVSTSGRALEPIVSEAPVDAQRVLFVGTSLTAGMGLASAEAFPALVAARLEERGSPIEAINAGVSGDTSAGGLSRLDWLLRVPPAVVVIELGANDGLRGLPLEMTESNLLAAMDKAQATGAEVVVAGMMVPPNYGTDYAEEFTEMFPRVASERGALLIPFLLEGVAGDPALNLPDGIHPNAVGHERIAEMVLPYLLEALGAKPAKAPRPGPPEGRSESGVEP